MRIVLLVALSLTLVTVIPAPAAAWDPFQPPSGCGQFHLHKGNVLAGEPPVYPHYHHCFG